MQVGHSLHDRRARARTALIARLRLFGLLVLVASLFGALSALVQEGIPGVEIQFVSRTVPIEVPVEVTVDRIVYRVVHVPVPAVTARLDMLWARIAPPALLAPSAAAGGAPESDASSDSPATLVSPLPPPDAVDGLADSVSPDTAVVQREIARSAVAQSPSDDPLATRSDAESSPPAAVTPDGAALAAAPVSENRESRGEPAGETLDGQVASVVAPPSEETTAPIVPAVPPEPPVAEAPPVVLPPAEAPPSEPPAVALPPAEVPPLDAPPVDAPPVDVPPVQAPLLDVLAVDPPAVNVPAVALPAVNAPAVNARASVNAPAVDLPPVTSPPVQAAVADLPALQTPGDQVRSATAPAAREPAPEPQTFADGTPLDVQTEPGGGRVDASLTSVGAESKSGDQLVEVSAGAPSSPLGEGATRVDAQVNAPTILSDNSGASTLVDASAGVTSVAAASENTSLTVHSDAGAGNGNAASVSASVDSSSNAGTLESSASFSVSVDTGGNSGGGNDSSSSSVSVSVSFDTSSNSSGGGDNGSNSGGGGGGTSISVGGISVSLP